MRSVEVLVVMLLMSGEPRRLQIGIVASSKMLQPACGKMSNGDGTHYWSCCNKGTHLWGVAEAVSEGFCFLIIEATPVDECILQVRVKHTQGFISHGNLCLSLDE